MPKKISKIIAKAVIVNNSDVLLIRRSGTDTRRPLQWDIPGGAVEEQENYTDAVSREIGEETGLSIASDSLELIYAKTESHEEGVITFLFYEALAQSRDVILSFEHDIFKWVSVDEVNKLIDYPLHKELLKFITDNKLLS